MKKNIFIVLILIAIFSVPAFCGIFLSASAETAVPVSFTSGMAAPGAANMSASGTYSGEIDTSVSNRDASGEYDASSAIVLSAEDDLTITAAGVYILSGTYENKMVVVDAGDEDKIQIVLKNAVLTNAYGPAIFVRNADKVFLTAAEGTENMISDGPGYSLFDGETALDAAVFSRDDLTINGSGSLTISGNTKHAVVSKDDLVVTAKDLTVNAINSGLTGKDAVKFSEASAVITAGSDGIHSEGSIALLSGSCTLRCADDGIHADGAVKISGGTVNITASEGIEATYILITGGETTIQATDDGVNAAWKTASYTPTLEITGGIVTVTMGAGDTDAIDSNGNIIITGGTISVNGNSAFDYDGSAIFTGGTVYVNGQQVTTLPNQMMGGGMGGFGGKNGFGRGRW